MTNLPTQSGLSPRQTWSAVGSMALWLSLLIASAFMPFSLLTPIVHDLHATEGIAGQLISISGLFAVVTVAATLIGGTMLLVLASFTIGREKRIIVTERGDAGVARIKELTNGLGADSVLECVGSEESMMQAIQSTRPGGSIGCVGVPHGMQLNMWPVFSSLFVFMEDLRRCAVTCPI